MQCAVTLAAPTPSIKSVKERTVRKRDRSEEKLPPHWEKVHGAIWLIGLAILFATDHIWPGILILVAISSLAQAGLMAYVKRNQEVQTLTTEREAHLPENCPNCGGPLNAASVRWQGKQSAICPYCGSTVKAIVKASA
jgi:hypothetical protein